MEQPPERNQAHSWLDRHRATPPVAVDATEIVGIGHVKDEIDSLVGRLANPEVMAKLGADLPRGILFWGEPGTGKTLIARHLATRLGPDVPMYQLSGDELTPALLRDLFAQLDGAHERCVLYLDEIDLIAQHRSWEGHDSATRATLVALLAALDGLRQSTGPIVVAASNRAPDELDPALMRAGRIGVHIHFGLPDPGERLELFQLFLSRRPIGELDLARLVGLTPGWTPAAIRAAVDDATGLALAAGRKLTTQDDLLRAVRRGGEITPEPEAEPPVDPTRLRRTAVHEAGHVAVAVGLRGGDSVSRVTLSKWGGRSVTAGMEAYEVTSSVLRDQLAVGYGGLAAEEAIYGDITLGVSGDVAALTQLACQLAAVGQLPGAVAVDPAVIVRQFGGALTRQAAATEAALLVARQRAAEIVAANREAIERFAVALLDHFAAWQGRPSIDEEYGHELTGRELHQAIEAAGFGAAEPRAADHAIAMPSSSPAPLGRSAAVAVTELDAALDRGEAEGNGQLATPGEWRSTDAARPVGARRLSPLAPSNVIRFWTETGSCYEIDQVRLTWRRTGATGRSGRLHSESGRLLRDVRPVLGEGAVLVCPPRSPRLGLRLVVTSAVVRIENPRLTRRR